MSGTGLGAKNQKMNKLLFMFLNNDLVREKCRKISDYDCVIMLIKLYIPLKVNEGQAQELKVSGRFQV